ncbi:branched-chain amino acid ABC transporter permease [Clostridium sp. YIM B02515]|uniref:Branched-chain amino acid ABC transporter permease n=1 Tax=Clostridium rhizosphaerae TaxID=2803861 RepID=A0ABS1T851_9CLOT|nr:branched-chain amino acid ABC transporter permease [Clostridium rhizosphaerae]MBL4935533.1 branched-chain amino acid ABC transporter permease [Clostridium rhizosphaerae]
MLKINKKTIVNFIAVAIVYLVLFGLIKGGLLNRYYEQILVLIGINIILALSLNLVIGFTGQLTLGHAGFMSVGAYAAAMLTIKLHLPFLLCIVLGGAAAGLVGFLIGLPILRLKGDYLAITTLGFGEMIRVAITNIEPVGGARGLAGIPPKTTFTTVFLGVIITFIILKNIINSTQGRAMIATRENEIAAEAMGINTTEYKLIAFVIASFFAGVAGALYAHYFMFLEPNSFNFMKSIEIVTYVVLGGMGSLSGSMLSAGILTLLPEALREFANYRMIVYSLLLILIMIFRPQGLMGNKELSFKMFKSLNKKGGNANASSGR